MDCARLQRRAGTRPARYASSHHRRSQRDPVHLPGHRREHLVDHVYPGGAASTAACTNPSPMAASAAGELPWATVVRPGDQQLDRGSTARHIVGEVLLADEVEVLRRRHGPATAGKDTARGPRMLTASTSSAEKDTPQ